MRRIMTPPGKESRHWRLGLRFHTSQKMEVDTVRVFGSSYRRETGNLDVRQRSPCEKGWQAVMGLLPFSQRSSPVLSAALF